MNSRFSMKKLPVIAALLASGTVLLSQSTTGMLSGRVLDPKDKPVAGVLVTISSPALFSPRVVTSDEKGNWRAPALPPGNYKVVVSKANWVGSSAENIRVGVGAMVSQELTVKPVVAGEAVVEVVASNTAVVDKADTKIATNISADTLLVLPTSNRSFEGAANLTPGVVMSANGSPSIGGGTTNSTLYRVDGVDIKNDLQGTRTGTGVMEDMIEDIQVVTSPLNGRNGRTTGGTINVSKKAGGNDFSGSIRSTFYRNSWRANKVGSINKSIDERNDSYGDRTYAITFMGPIIKDKLWFSLGTTMAPNTATPKTITEVGPSPVANYKRAYQTSYGSKTPTTAMTNIDAETLKGPSDHPGYKWTGFDTGALYDQLDDTKYVEGKLTYALTADHTIDLSMAKETNTNSNRDSGYSYAQLSQLGKQTAKRDIFGLGYRALLSSNVLLEASYNFYTTEIEWSQHIDSAINDPIAITNGDYNGTTHYSFTSIAAPNTTEIRGSRSAKVNLHVFLDAAGNHEFDFGYDQYTGRYRTTTQSGPNNRRFFVGGAYTNGTDYLFPSIAYPMLSTGLPNTSGMGQNGLYGLAPTLLQYFGSDGETNTFNQGVYLTDAWTINNNWNVMLSVRGDFYSIKDTDGAQLAKSHAITPRLSVKYDPFGDSQHVLTFTAARYADDFSTGFTTSFIKKATAVSLRSGWTGNGLVGGQPVAGTVGDATYGVRYINYADLSNMANFKLANGNYNIFQMTATSAYNIDPNLKVPTSDEVTLGYSRNFGGGSRVGITARSRVWHDQWAFGQDYVPSQFVLMQDPTGSGKGVNVQKTNVFNGDLMKRSYTGLDLDFVNVLTPRWAVQGLVTYSRLKGNDQGGDDPTSSFRSNAATALYYQPTQMAATGVSQDRYSPDGFLANQQLLKARLSLIGTFAVGKGTMSYAWMGSYDSGSRYNAADTWGLGLTSVTNTNPMVIGMPALPYTRNEFYAPRGAYGFNDSFTVDFKMSWNMPLGLWKVRLIGDLSVFNFFNQQRQISWQTTYTANSTAGTTALTVKNPSLYGTVDPGTVTTNTYYQNALNEQGQRSFNASCGFKF